MKQIKTRQDAWSHEDDSLLAEIVLKHIREGSTQLNAFEEVGDKLNRTSAACGFRWNAVVRFQYEKDVVAAKKQRKNKMRALKSKTKPLYQPKINSLDLEISNEFVSSMNEIRNKKETRQDVSSSLTMDMVIDYLLQMNSSKKRDTEIEEEFNVLQNNYNLVMTENMNMKKELEKMKAKMKSVEEDYLALVSIMNRARKMIVFGNDDENNSSFKMDKNGNLERMAN